MRRAVATLAVAALLVVAGCSAGGGDTTTTPTYDTDVEPIYETPLAAEAVAESHVDALRAHETFTVDVNVTWSERGNEQSSREMLVRANLTSGAVYEHEESDSGVQQAYRFGNGTAYARSVSSGGVTYDEVRRGIDNASSTATGSLPIVVEWFSFTYAGATQVDGERVYVYRARGAEQFSPPSDPVFGENTTIRDAAATVAFREDGTVKRLNYSLDVDTDHGPRQTNATIHYEKLGDTDASPPLWIPDARNATE
jgi:hypothetical protein